MEKIEYITDEQFEDLLKDISQKIHNGEIEECRGMLDQLIDDADKSRKYIDRTYIGAVKEKKRNTQIAAIQGLLNEMNSKQVENVYTYVIDEHAEENHEALALEVITRLSEELGTYKK